MKDKNTSNLSQNRLITSMYFIQNIYSLYNKVILQTHINKPNMCFEVQKEYVKKYLVCKKNL